MIELTVVDDLRSSLNSVLEAKTSQTSKDDCDYILAVVGEEENGLLIYSWNSLSQQSSEIVTHIGVYNRHTKIKKEVYRFDRCTKVVNATISPEQSFLAFVTWEQSVSDGQGIYSAYIAEIRPANHLYSLSLETPYYILLQFMYVFDSHSNIFWNTELKPATTFELGAGQTYKVHLLVIRHMESIGIYHISTAQLGDGLIMDAEPKKEQLLHRRILWAQWDMTHRSLYVLQLRKKDLKQDLDVLPLLTVYQFSENGTFQELMRLIVDLPITYSKTRLKYLEIAPCKFIPVSTLNFHVMQHRSNGTMCICYQHAVDGNSRKNSRSSNGLAQLTWYTVLVLHCGKMLQAKYSQPIPGKALVTFAWLDDYLLVHLSGHFSHLLNVSVYGEPVHHILWQGGDGCQSNGCRHLPLLNFASHDHPGLELYDSLSNCIYKVVVSDGMLIKMFQETEDIQTRLTILRYAVSYSLVMVKKLFEIMRLCSFFFLELRILMEEYLVSSTFEFFRWQVDASLLSLIPFTSFRALSAMNLHEKLYSYLPIWSQESVKTSRSHSHRYSASLLSPQERLQKRFNLYAVKQLLLSADLFSQSMADDLWVKIDLVDDLDAGKARKHHRNHIVRYTNLMASFSGGSGSYQSPAGMASQTELLLGKAPSFIGSDSDVETMLVEKDAVMRQTSEFLESHLRNQFPQLSLTKIRKLAHEYIRCQLRSSRRLLYIIWSVCKGGNKGQKEEREEDDGLLCSPVLQWELGLLKFLESYRLVTDRLSFPHPVPFFSYFASLVFRCRSLNDFLQHLDRGVVLVELEFCIKIIKELDDCEDNVKLKMQLIRNLNQADMLTCYQLWGHPHALQLLAQNFAANCWSNDGMDVVGNTSLINCDQSLLPSVALFLQHLEKKGFKSIRNHTVNEDNKSSTWESSAADRSDEILQFPGDVSIKPEDLLAESRSSSSSTKVDL